jgi:Predicted nucleoside-diphosphate sugar epimerases
MGFYTDKKVLITGGTGTIGQHLIKRILKDRPAVIRIFSRDEHKQFEMQQTLNEHNKDLRYLIGDIRDKDRLTRAMEGIDYVFHLAAMKHVPACEYNPFEAVQTNVIGTQNVIQSSIQSGVTKVLFTSTDKAISPTNTYGATKLMAERLVSAAQFQAGPKNTIFSSVRFGNVMGSRGSVIPLFKRQIQEKRKITITRKEMSRFMMSAAQAIDLMIRAMNLAQGGEVFVLKMPTIRLEDLSSVIIEEISKRLNTDSAQVHIEEIGLRAGEKMFEELMTEEEAESALELPEMFIVPSDFLGKHNYQGATKAGDRGYSSQKTQYLEKEEIRLLLLRNALL